MSAAALQYAVKISPKARNLRLKMTLERGLEVIVPSGFDPRRIPPLLSRKQHWIESAQRRLREQRKFFEPKPPGELPDHVVLRALGETWRVEYREAQTPWAAVCRQSQDRVVIRGNVENVAACQDVGDGENGPRCPRLDSRLPENRRQDGIEGHGHNQT